MVWLPVQDRPVRHSLSDRIEIKPHLLQNINGDALTKVDQSEKQVLGTHIVVVKSIRFLSCKGQHLLCSRCKITHWLGHNSFINGKTTKVNLPQTTDRSAEFGETLS